jgi:outer membrane protein insertion porin family
VKFRLLFVLLGLSLLWTQPLYSRAIRLAVIPLALYSEEDLTHLRKPLMDVILRTLRQQGFQPVSALGILEEKPSLRAREMTDVQARKIGAELQTNFVIYGSLSKIGEQISFDVRLVDVNNQRPTTSIYVTQEGLENLASAVSKLSDEVGIRILRRKKINRVTVAGNERIETEAIKLNIKTKSGDLFDQAKLRQDLTAIYKMGYFKEVRIEAEETPQGEDVVFVVSEKPTINKVTIKGAKVINKEDLQAAMTTRQYGILQRSVLKEDVEKIRALYRDKGYYDAEVTYEVKPLEGNKVDVAFHIKEKKKLYISRITFTGNQHFSDDELKDVIETSEKGTFFWLTDSGILKREKLEVDSDRLAAFYLNYGFMDVKVGRPEATYDEQGIYINFPIDEGHRFRVGKVEVSGKDIEPKIRIRSIIELSQHKYFDREALAKDLQNLTDFFTSRGYAFAEVTPKINKDDTQQVVDVDYEINKGELVYFARIDITGDTKTRDKVIRRQLKVIEGALYSKADLERSVRNLQRLDFFESVDVDTRKGETADKMDVQIKVKEKPTRSISAGVGYSSADELFFQTQLAESNLFGRGQNLQFTAQLGTISNTFSLKFTEPWLFDIPLSMSIEAYNWRRDYDDYNKTSWGGRTGFGYPVWDYTRLYLSYIYDDAKISNVSSDAAQIIKDQEGRLVTSALSSTLRRDSKDHPFLTTRGSDNSLTLDYAGGFLGGNAGYIKGEINSSWYFPLFWECVGFLHGRTGYIIENGGEVPIYERFYLGGINSIRSFGSGQVSPKDPDTGDRIGGNKMILFNAEFLFPLIGEQGVRGVLFFDAGNAYNNGDAIDLSDLKYAIGGGIRWHSPMGPLRLEWGYNPDRKKGDPESKWQFSMGVFF